MENTNKYLNNKRVNILGINVDSLTMKETIAEVEKYVQDKKFLHLMGVNADKVLQCIDSPQFKNLVNSCDIINADGISLVLASKLLGNPLPERVAGIDLMLELIKQAEIYKKTIYFLGAKQEIVERTVKNIQKNFPDVNIVGYRNGYFKKDEWKDISNNLKELSPDYIFVGITSPLKEEIIYFLENEGNTGVFMGVGGSFDVLSGSIKRAPILVQKLNLEWLFRISQEPRRLFKRYLFGNFRFIYLVLVRKLRK